MNTAVQLLMVAALPRGEAGGHSATRAEVNRSLPKEWTREELRAAYRAGRVIEVNFDGPNGKWEPWDLLGEPAFNNELKCYRVAR